MQDIDLTDAAFLADPYPVYNHLRERRPVFYSQRYNVWFLSRYQDIKSVFTNETEFGFAGAFKGPHDLQPTWAETVDATKGMEGYIALRHKVTESQGLWIANRDMPDHNRLRKEFNPPFMPAALKAGEPEIRSIVREILDKMEGKQEVDIITELGVPLASRVFLNLLGVDHSNSEWILEQSLHLNKLFFLGMNNRDKEQGLAALIQFMQFFKKRIQEKGIGNDDGLIGLLLKGQCLGRISMDEVFANLSFFILAGVQSTIYFIGNVFYSLMRNPDQIKLLKAAPEKIEQFNEEAIRLETVNAFSTRYTMQDTEVGGVVIPKNHKIVLLTGSANRDESVFHNSNSFIADRSPNPHLAFGFATRYCIGAYLTRTEARLAVEEMLNRFPQFSIDPTQELSWFYNFRIRGLNHLKVRLNGY